MGRNHANIPIFLPQLACPHQCIFCNQNHISSQEHIPSIDETRQIIERNLTTIPSDYTIQVAFFGGSFTGLPIETQESYLQIVQPFIKTKQVSSIRLSTRPDYITDEILAMLQKYNVQDIELGAQSTNDEILRLSGRGHNREAIQNASQKIKEYGFRLGLQMMIGLPGDTKEISLQTAQDIIDFGAETTRIYPTLVVSDTPLATLYNRGKYTPLSTEDAIDWTKDIYSLFIKNNITVLKVGLHPNKDFTNKEHLLAGPFHPSFKELVLSEIWKDKLKQVMQNNCKQKNISIFTSSEEINNAIGYNSKNKKELLQLYKNVFFNIDPILTGYEFTYCRY
ncbi:MAG: radical SAM protein [Bacteroidales bacterium]|nr:radical SAM protein [Bacteroidales bacterium]